ncbi:MAG: hypothetical protein ACYC4L_11180 [Chloroflexota bacterium]
MAEKQDNNFARIDASTEVDFKCTRCGAMFDAEDEKGTDCPVCGFVCTPETCRVFNTSKEGF